MPNEERREVEAGRRFSFTLASDVRFAARRRKEKANVSEGEW